MVLEDDEVVDRALLRSEVDELMRLVEIKWQQKAKLQWKVEGENMTKFYHRLVNLRRKVNQLQTILIDGEEINEVEVIKTHIIQFYKELFDDDGIMRPELDGMVFDCITQEESSNVERRIEESEVLAALKAMNGEKAPRPDGLPMKVYKACW
ncbi:hypothetical protein FRX31_024847, partial [Thalictrum thalictroides]